MVGVYFCHMHKVELLINNSSITKNNEKVKKMYKKLKALEKWYESHGENQGFDNSCHIMRE